MNATVAQKLRSELNCGCGESLHPCMDFSGIALWTAMSVTYFLCKF